MDQDMDSIDGLVDRLASSEDKAIDLGNVGRIHLDAESLISKDGMKVRNYEETKGHDWGSMRAKYVNSRTITLKEIGEEFHANYENVRQRSAKEGWVLERQRIQREFVKVATQESMRKQARAAITFNSSCLDAAAKLVELIHQTIEDAELTGVILPPNELGHLSRALKTSQEGGRLALGLSTDNKDVHVSDQSLEDKSLDEIDGELLMLMGDDAFQAYKSGIASRHKG